SSASSAACPCAIFLDESDQIFGAHRSTEIKALNLVAAFRTQHRCLLHRLDALGDDLEVQAVPEAHDGAHDRGVARVSRDVAHEALFDFQPVDREVLDVGERRIAGAEVVNGDADAELAQL